MSFLGRLFGDAPPVRRRPRPGDPDVVDSYRFVVRTAPAETLEQVHAEAFTRLTDAQRAVIYEELSRGAGTGERPLSSEPATLARAATRAELRREGALERAVTPALLPVVAESVVGSPLVGAFLPWDAARGGDWIDDQAGDVAS